jgi:hypothetical protein
MAGKWSAKDRRRVTWGLVFTGVAILFVLVATTPIERWIALGFVLLCGVGTTGYGFASAPMVP